MTEQQQQGHASEPIPEHRVIVPKALTRPNREAFASGIINALATGQKHIVLNFGRCEALDGAGMGKLISLKHIIEREHHGTLVVEHVPDALWEKYFGHPSYIGVFTVRDRAAG